MKFNISEIYQDRIKEIDKQLRAYVHLKNWNKVKQLRDEKKELMQKIQRMQAKEE